jgi:hypothetical protein
MIKPRRKEAVATRAVPDAALLLQPGVAAPPPLETYDAARGGELLPESPPTFDALQRC